MRDARSTLLAIVLLAAAAAFSAGCGGTISADGPDGRDGGDGEPTAPDATADETLPPEDDGGTAVEEESEVDVALDEREAAAETHDAPADDASEEEAPPESCGFNYDDTFVYPFLPPLPLPPDPPATDGLSFAEGYGMIAWDEPLPPSVSVWRPAGSAGEKDPGITMPGYSDTMPLFARGADWTGATRCYETPSGVRVLTQAEAFDLYRRIAELTTGVAMRTTAGVRTVVGLRGAYPGRFLFNGNKPDRFNDTLVLLWVDAGGGKHVREFPVNTDTGAHNFGTDSSSSLRANRRYLYVDGWHRTYNALHIDEDGYRVRDDGNKNGHWDSDRNGWLPPAGSRDRDRTGGGHNIHMGSVDAPLGRAAVDVWSAGCQVIPGMANWREFITSAWTREGDRVDYFLVDVRDVDPRVWADCAPDGSHACPWHIETLPYSHASNTMTAGASLYDVYNCSDADEGGPEVVYFFTTDRGGTVTAAVDDADPVDVDVHLLDANDRRACMARGHNSLELSIGPGRYFVVVDSYVDGATVLGGAYTLTVGF